MTPTAFVTWLYQFCTPRDYVSDSWRPWSVEIDGYRWAYAASRFRFVLVPDVVGINEAREAICLGVNGLVHRRGRRWPDVGLTALRRWCNCGPVRSDQSSDYAYGQIDGVIINRRLLHPSLCALQRAYGDEPITLDLANHDEALVVHGAGWYVGLMPVYRGLPEEDAKAPRFRLLSTPGGVSVAA